MSDTFIPLSIAVLTISDTRTEADDRSGQTLIDKLQTAGHTLFARKIVKDERALIAEAMRAWVDEPQVHVILSTGGTGVTARDVTPEAVRDVIEKEIPGFGELFRYQSLQTIGTSTIQSRAIAGVAKKTYIFALPGSTGAVKDAWNGILETQLDSRTKPCNFADLIERL